MIEIARSPDDRDFLDGVPLAIHLKLNELVAALQGASNRLIEVEALSEKELRTLQEHFAALAARAGEEADIAQSHSVEEADRRHLAKSRGRDQKA
jgi:low affinity Fe/Cu permease